MSRPSLYSYTHSVVYTPSHLFPLVMVGIMTHVRLTSFLHKIVAVDRFMQKYMVAPTSNSCMMTLPLCFISVS